MQDTDEIDAHYHAGQEYYDAGRYEDAIREWRLSAECDPENARRQYNLGFALSETGRDNEASEYYRKAIRLEPDYFEAYYALIRERYLTLYDSRDKSELRDLKNLCRRAAKLDANNPEFEAAVLMMLSRAQWLLGERQEAIHSIRRAIEVNPDDLDYYFVLGRMQKGIFDFVGSFYTAGMIVRHTSYDPSMCVPSADCKRKLTAFALLAVGGVLMVRHLRRTR